MVQSISFPRSGHHLLMRLLARYFSRDLSSYTDPLNGSLLVAGDFVYCTYYPHCNARPCSDPRTTIQKNHDFDLLLPIEQEQQYLIQYRSPIPAICSWYIASIKNKRLEDSLNNWQLFLNEKLAYYQNFLNKWILTEEVSNHTIIRYETLLENPLPQFRRAVLCCKPDDVFDRNWAAEVIELSNIVETNPLADFQFYDPEYFQKCLREIGLHE